MVVTVLKEKTKTVFIEQPDENNEVVKIPVEIPNGFVKYKMEIDNISTFSEDVSVKTNKVYKRRCLLRMYDGWILVNHSFDELQQMKNILHRKVQIKGFHGTYQDRRTDNKKGSTKTKSSRKKG
jgi:hypothetical protein